MGPEETERLAGHEEIARGQDVHVLVPELERGVLDGGRGGEARIGDEDVEAAEFDHGMGEAGNDLLFPGDVDVDRPHHVGAEGARELGHGAVERGLVDVGEDDAGAFAQEPDGRRLADAAGAAGDERDLAGQRLGLGHALQLGFLEEPVFDVEGFLLGQALIFGNRRGAAHDVDGVDVELAGNAGRGLVLGEGDHAHAGDEIDHRIGIADGGRVVVLAALVIGRVIGAIGGDLIGQAGDDGIDIGLLRIEVDHQRPDFGAQEVVGAGGAQGRSGLRFFELTNSRTAALSSKCPSLWLSSEMKPRILGMRRAAMARRCSASSDWVAAPPKMVLPSVSRSNHSMA